MARLLSLYLFALAVTISTLATDKHATNYILPRLINGSVPSSSDHTLGYEAYDRAYNYPHNLTSYEWWYFDAVSSDGLSSVVIQPIVLGPPLGNGTQLRIQLVFPNGSSIYREMDYLVDEPMYVSTKGDGSSGVIGGGDASWVGQPDLGEYRLKLDLKDDDIRGTVTFLSELSPEARTDLFWYLNWINLVPDAVALVDLKIGEERLAFTGNGYHDKNWGPYLFGSFIDQWYWGHGRAGPYSVVWFYLIPKAGGLAESKALGWVSKDGEVLYSACGGGDDQDTISVKPYGEGVEFPIPGPNMTSNIEGFDISFRCPYGEDGADYAFRFTKKVYTQADLDQYARWIGNIEGGPLAGGDGAAGNGNVTGSALCEQMGPFFDLP
ncbi:hypothetical protein I316_03289 [Kwoniella heveanensis BCC8398]|uniref:AttH domain-containing protein n=1 Tax=Kwoniella heveanensis BCC8398 TaxID=1296120 RepID=A0A1B9GUN7_9TREE|nr:hypothetical protein I316_03289 [Kwoniella heveanensis BCC8398]